MALNRIVNYSSIQKESSNRTLNEKLIIFSINVNSLVHNIRRYNLFHAMTRLRADVVLVSETKLNNSHKINFDNYTTIRSDRFLAQKGGGTAIFIKNRFRFTRINLKCQSLLKNIECTIIKLNLNHNKKFYIISVYAAGLATRDFVRDFKLIVDELKLDDTNNYYLLGGDLNARHQDWGDEKSNYRGRSLKNWLQKNDLRFRTVITGPREPSFPSKNSFIDIAIHDTRVNIINKINNKIPVIPYDSDHNGLLMHICLQTDENFLFEKPLPQNKINFNQTNWSSFYHKMFNHPSLPPISEKNNLSNNEINNYLNELDELVLKTLVETTPPPKRYDSISRYINGRIIKGQHIKGYLLSCIHRMKKQCRPYETEIEIYKILLKRVKKKLQKLFRTSVNDYWSKKIKNIKMSDNQKIFPKLNPIFRPHKINEIPNLIINSDRNDLMQAANLNANDMIHNNDKIIITENSSKLNILGAHYASVNNQTRTSNKHGLNSIIKNTISKFITDEKLNQTELKSFVTFSESNLASNPSFEIDPSFFCDLYRLKKIIHKLKSKKSTGVDGIPMIAIKHLPDNVLFLYLILINNMLNNSHFPEKWKMAKIKPLLKKDKDPALPISYRPISLLPNMSKVYEIILNQSINKTCLEKNIIPDEQFGFKFKNSTIHAITKLTTDVNKALSGGRLVAACLIDLEKAFDMVWLDGLFFKLIRKGFPTHLLRTLWNSVRGKKIVVQDGEDKSDIVFSLNNGLQQGAVNSPILFNIFMGDILRSFGINKGEEVRGIGFADDLIVYITDELVTEAQSKLQALLVRLVDYFETWHLKCNVEKCETILFRPKLLDQLNKHRVKNKIIWRNFNISIGENNEIKLLHKKTVKYLGILVDDRLRFRDHITNSVEKARKTFFSLKGLFYSRYLEARVKVLCYVLLIRPILTYGCAVWFGVSPHTIEKLRTFERYCLRVCLGMYRDPATNYMTLFSNKKIYNKADIPRIDSFIIKLTRNHIANAIKNETNPYISAPFKQNIDDVKKIIALGRLPVEAFPILDREGYVQDDNNLPILYHVSRHVGNGLVKFSKYDLENDNTIRLVYSRALPPRDINDKSRLNVRKYPWLQV